VVHDWSLMVWGPKVFADLVTGTPFTIQVTGVHMNAAESTESF
jgi:hypothetical protein